jgi:hypothetical protein
LPDFGIEFCQESNRKLQNNDSGNSNNSNCCPKLVPLKEPGLYSIYQHASVVTGFLFTLFSHMPVQNIIDSHNYVSLGANLGISRLSNKNPIIVHFWSRATLQNVPKNVQQKDL